MELADLQQKCSELMEENKELRSRVIYLVYILYIWTIFGPDSVTFNLLVFLFIFQLMQYEPSPDGEAAE